MSSSEDRKLIDAYVEGEPEAHRQVGQWIRGVVDSRHWGLSHQREDILQEVHQRLFVNLRDNRFRSASALKTYVGQIAKYTCIEFLRKKIRANAVALDDLEPRDPRPSPEQRLAASERGEQASQALADLPEGCRRLFELIFEQKLPYEEIGRRLGIAEGTVKSRAWRCRELLMKRLRSKGVAQNS